MLPDRPYTVASLHQFLGMLLENSPGYADCELMINVWSWEDGDTLAYVTHVAPIHAFLPDGEGGPDIEREGFVLQIEGFFGPEDEDG